MKYLMATDVYKLCVIRPINLMQSMSDLSMNKDLEGVKVRVSNMLKKRKKMSSVIKAY